MEPNGEIQHVGLHPDYGTNKANNMGSPEDELRITISSPGSPSDHDALVWYMKIFLSYIGKN